MKVFFLRPDADQREFEAICEISSYESLQQFFDSFDWVTGAKTIELRKKSDLPYFLQTLRFQRNATDYVDITPASDEEYCISCINGKSFFETETSGDVTGDHFSIEEFLGDFWSENLVDKYNFEEGADFKEADMNSESGFGVLRLWPLALFAFLSIMLLDKKSKPVSLINFSVALIPLVCALPYLLLLLQYFRHNKSSTLSVNKKDRTLTIVRQGNSRTSRIKDVTKSKIVINNTRKSLTRGWGYLLLEFGPQDRIIITTFLYEDIESLAVFLGLKPVRFNSIYPLITLGIKSDGQLIAEKNEHELKVHEFVEKWSGKSKEELMKIKQNPSGYAAYAVEAARKLLKTK
ncbi:MAG: hypothetical protein M3R17_00185 [Bacteroidota bacterium]|nr:hypothetical protein [Bacteroidota bacterium]